MRGVELYVFVVTPALRTGASPLT